MAGLGLNFGYLLVHIFNFLIMVVILSALAYKPILKALDNRRQKIAQGLEDARIAAEARANAEQEASKIISEAQAKASQIVREASDRAETAAREIRSQAEAEASKERDIALAEINQERERILSDLRGQVGALAIAVAQKLIGETLDERRQRALINEFFSGIESGRVMMMDNSSINGASAEVTSALPLTQDEKELVKRDVLSKLGNQATVSFRVDPTILGGLVVRVGDKILDGSVGAQLEGLRQAIA